MAERIVSPGVFTREKDLSFLPAGIAQLGAAIVGPTLTGPAMVPTQVTSYSDFENQFGGQSTSNYTAYTVKSYLQRGGAPSATIVRVLGNGGYSFATPITLSVTSDLGTRVAAVLMPTISCSAATFDFSTTIFTGSTAAPTSSASASNISLVIRGANVGEQTYSISLNPSDSTYLTKVFGTSPNTTRTPVYVASHFPVFLSSSFAGTVTTASLNVSTAYTVSGSAFGEYGFTEAVTPWIIDQSSNKLFRFHTFADGTDANTKFKVSISSIKSNDIAAGGDDVAEEYFSSFTVQVRSYSDTDLKINVVETFDSVNLNKESTNYIARRIGDKYLYFDGTTVITKGDYPNLSKYIYIEMYDTEDIYDKSQYPFGFENLYKPFNGTIPTASFVTALSGSDGSQNDKLYFGFDFANVDNVQYIAPSPASAVSSADFVAQTSNTFLLSNCKDTAGAAITINSTLKQRKFSVPFHAGFDGMKPYIKKNVGADITTTNVMGFDCSTATAAGSKTYKAAITTLSNPDEIDINMLVVPGIIKRLHSSVTSHAITMCEDRGDVFYLMDSADIEDSITTVTSEVSTLDSNYTATYYPWVKIIDDSKNLPLWVPPSVVIAGAIAFNDRLGAEWFAPAGLNRGGLTEVIEAYTRLTQSDRDDLYEGRVNPIATFPGTGVSVWGQKTLQAKPSALDRINVRRLIINLKKFIASSSRYLVFEQNTSATRARFLNIVNPYLESVQSRSGLSAFRVVMDETNNTAEVIDRNQLVGQIYIQPTRTAEFIVLDFVVLPTGAAFPA